MAQEILPKPGKRNILITSALPYVNNVPHLGNIIGCVLSADVFARYCRLRDYNALFICGTDEYGTATETKALKEDTTPRAICDKYFKIHDEIYKWFNISFDKFGRTSTEEQTQITQDIFNKIHKNGYTLEDELEQLYCPTCERFLADRFVEGTCPHCNAEGARGDQCDACQKLLNPIELKNPRCQVSGTTPIPRKSKHLFLDLPQLYNKLATWFEPTALKGDWSANSTQITRTWIRPDGLKPRCITRDLKWGTPVPLPGFTDKVFYVWFDAPIGYISITATYTKEWEKWWKNPSDVQLYQFMGKDNVPFHTVIFPGSLLGTGDPYTLLHHLSTTEFLNYENTKFSKSKGVGVFGDQAISTGIPSEVWRYYLLVNRPETSDSNFSWEDFSYKVNTELRDNLGNFVNRTLKFVLQNFGGKIPEASLLDVDNEFVKSVGDAIERYIHLMEKVKLKDALRETMALSSLGNKYFQDNKPWQLVNEDIKRCGTVIFVAVNLVRTLASLIEPFLPTLADKIFAQLNCPHSCIKEKFELTVPAGHIIGVPEPLVVGIDAAKIAECREKFGGQPTSGFPADIKVGEVAEVADHPQADNLYVLKITLGAEQRTIVSGLKGAYPDKTKLHAKKVLVLCNLKDAKFKGIVSQGMILVADSGTGQVEVLTVQEQVPLGAVVIPQGGEAQPNKQRITVPDFYKLDLRIVGGVTTLKDGTKLVADGKPVVPDGTLQTANVR